MLECIAIDFGFEVLAFVVPARLRVIYRRNARAQTTARLWTISEIDSEKEHLRTP